MKVNFTLSVYSFLFFVGLLPASAQPFISYSSFISTGLSSPIEIVNAGDGSGRLFIAEKGGAIKVWVSGTTVLPTPFLTVPSLASGNEQGLLSVAFHPEYETNGFFYVYYTRSSDGAIVIARYSNPTPADNIAEGAADVLLVIPHPGQSNHNGGHLQFRKEGSINYLYFATGDGGSGDDPPNNSQNDASRLGKMLRMNVDLPLPITPEIYAKGLRNPFRWSFDRSTGNIWIGDVGQNLKEEVDFWPAAGGAGANFGWRCFEGTVQNTNVSPLCNPAGKIPPVFEYDNPAGSPPSAVTGGYVYRGSNSALAGYYVTTDFYSGQIWLLNPNGTVARTQNLASNIAAYGESEAGELYAVSLTGNLVYSIAATGNSALPVTLITFSVKQFSGYNEIRWASSFEQNADRYIVEYSADGNSFASAGDISALNNNTGHSYSFRHDVTNTRKIYYRLQMLDRDGSARYSSIISIGGNDKGNVTIYPTVLQNKTLQITGNVSLDKLTVFSATGNEVYRNYLNGAQGYISVQLPELAKGIYLVSLSGEDFNQTKKIIIQ